MTIPYTYRVYSKATNNYYGVRFAKNCCPSDLFVSYFTSSKGVKKLIEIYGIDNFEIEIRKIFDTKEKAISWERRVNRWTMRWPNYLNRHSNGNFILSDEERKEISIRAGNKCKELKLGFHSMPEDDRLKASRKGAATNKENSTGIYSLSKDRKIEIGNKCKELKLGFHSEESRKRQRKSAKQPWWNNGKIDIKSECSPGTEWTKGRLTKGKKWWNNGKIEVMSKNQPDNTYKKGRLK